MMVQYFTKEDSLPTILQYTAQLIQTVFVIIGTKLKADVVPPKFQLVCIFFFVKRIQQDVKAYFYLLMAVAGKTKILQWQQLFYIPFITAKI